MDWFVLLHTYTLYWVSSLLVGRCYGETMAFPALAHPEFYVSLSGDLEFVYNFTDIFQSLAEAYTETADLLQAEVTLFSRLYNDTLTSVVFALVAPTGKLAFKCGSVFHSGSTVAQVALVSKTNTSQVVARLSSGPIDVRWPSFAITAPTVMETFTADVTVTLQSTGIACHPREGVATSRKSWLELVYAGRTNDTASAPGETGCSGCGLQVIQTVPDFHRIRSLDVTVRCVNFDQPGTYRVRLRTGSDRPGSVGDSVVAVSKAMRVTWSDQYALDVSTASVLPCGSDGLVVRYRHPTCILSKDRIRLYGRRRAPVAAALRYLAEQRVEKGRRDTAFPCALFDADSDNVAYCFKYVSVARHGAVSEVRSRCVPTYGREDTPVDGSWGPWSEWSSCPATCGSGTRIRHRVCDSPNPSNGGRFCDGEAVVAESCDLARCSDQSTATESPMDTYKMADFCRCGCSINLNEANHHYIAASGKSCTGISTWVVMVPLNSVVHFTFVHFELNASSECLQIRDGGYLSSDLLLHETGNRLPPPITTSSNVALLRYHTTPGVASDRHGVKRRATYGNVKTGFVVRMQMLNESHNLVPLTLGGLRHDRLPYNPVHVTATVFCLFLAFASLALVLHHAIYRRKAAVLARRRGGRSPSESSPVSLDGDDDTYSQHRQPLFQHVLTSTTSVSDLSLPDRVVRRSTRRMHRRRKRGSSSRRRRKSDQKHRRRHSPIESVGSLAAAATSSAGSSCPSLQRGGASPEDYLRDSKLFDSSPSTSIMSPVSSPERSPPPLESATRHADFNSVYHQPVLHRPPLPLAPFPSSTTAAAAVEPSSTKNFVPTITKKSPLTPGIPRKLPVATVSPQPARVLTLPIEPAAIAVPTERARAVSPTRKSSSEHQRPLVNGGAVRPAAYNKNGTYGAKQTNRASVSETSVTPSSDDSRQLVAIAPRPPAPRAAYPESESEGEEQRRSGVGSRRMAGVEGAGARSRHASGCRDGRRMVASLSEFSLSGTDAEFEYDYYDYGVHAAVPGSYLSQQHQAALSWLPPFLPERPHYAEEQSDYPLREFLRGDEAEADTSRRAAMQESVMMDDEEEEEDNGAALSRTVPAAGAQSASASSNFAHTKTPTMSPDSSANGFRTHS